MASNGQTDRRWPAPPSLSNVCFKLYFFFVVSTGLSAWRAWSCFSPSCYQADGEVIQKTGCLWYDIHTYLLTRFVFFRLWVSFLATLYSHFDTLGPPSLSNIVCFIQNTCRKSITWLVTPALRKSVLWHRKYLFDNIKALSVRASNRVNWLLKLLLATLFCLSACRLADCFLRKHQNTYILQLFSSSEAENFGTCAYLIHNQWSLVPESPILLTMH